MNMGRENQLNLSCRKIHKNGENHGVMNGGTWTKDVEFIDTIDFIFKADVHHLFVITGH